MNTLQHGCVLAAAVFLVWACPGQCAGLDISAEFESANRLCEQGRFDHAIAAYERLLEEGAVSAALYFNLGNAYFKSGRIGRAIAAYRTAEQLSPRDPDIRANLQFARNQVQAPTFIMSKLTRWFGTITLNEWTTSAAAVLWVFFVLLAVGEAKPALKPRIRSYIWFVGGTFVVLAACVVLACVAQRAANRLAVVIEPEVAVRQGPLDDALPAFVVHDGAELQVLDQKDNWLQVAVGLRRIGWVKRASVILPAETLRHGPTRPQT